MNIEGCISAIPTQFTDNGIDEQAFADHATWMVDQGCSGILVCGTTGEVATMTTDEKLRAMQIIVEAVGDRALVMGGTGNNHTAASVELTKRACAETGIDAVLAIVPYYIKPPQEGIKQHMFAIADASTKPVMTYNVPGRTVVSMTEQTISDLYDHPNIVSCKEASGNIFFDGKLLGMLQDRGTMLSGDDATAVAFCTLGGHGVVSVASNVAPKLLSQAIDAARNGDLATARAHNAKIVRLHELLFQCPSPIAVKVAMTHLGFGNPRVRLPLWAMDDAAANQLRSDLDALGIQR